MGKNVLVVDDDPAQRRLLEAAIERQGFEVMTAGDGAEALQIAGAPNAKPVDVVLLDLVMPGLSGMETLAELRKKNPELPVIVLTASGGIDTVVKAMQAGAVDFFVKPASPERIAVGIRNAMKMRTLTTEVRKLKKRGPKGPMTFGDLIAGAPSMRQVIKLGQVAAKSNIPILILGESGVGKELVARAIHGESPRAGGEMVAVNCGAIPDNLVESTLFGHKKGAFTGATDEHAGKFVEADAGTLFLDEVGELPLDTQVKLLRALQEGEVDAVGGKKPTKVDVRIISATNRDLALRVREGDFREDLFYRLNVFPIEVPPLRERREDIPALVQHFVSRFNAEEGKAVVGPTKGALELLVSHPWPGNVRQLENAIFRAVVLSEDELLQEEDFPQLIQAPRTKPAAAPAPPLSHHADEDEDADPIDRTLAPVGETAFASRMAPSSPAPAAPLPAEQGAADKARAMAKDLGVEILDPEGHLRKLEDIERDLIMLAIETYAGRMSEVARRLGIGRSTLYRKVREQGIEIDEPKSAEG